MEQNNIITNATIFDLFAGGGLVPIGARRAGWKSIGGVEINKQAADFYANSMGHRPVVADITDVDPKDAVLFPNKPTWLHASPPCQHFSKARTGGARTDHPDKDAGKQVCKFIREWLPAYFTLENVTDYNKSESLWQIEACLTKCGYWFQRIVINAADYGVPQKRKRLWVIAARMEVVPFPILPAPNPKHIGWYSAIEDLLPSLRETTLAPWQVKALVERAEVLRTKLIANSNTTSRQIKEAWEPAMVMARSKDSFNPRILIGPQVWNTPVGGDLPAPAVVKTHGACTGKFLPPDNGYQYRPSREEILEMIKASTVLAANAHVAARFQSLKDHEYELPKKVNKPDEVNQLLAGSIIGNGVPPAITEMLGRCFAQNIPPAAASPSSPFDVRSIARDLIEKTGEKVSDKFHSHLVEFLAEAYGIRRSELVPDLQCFVNAQASVHQGEKNNIAGSIQLSPGRVRKKGGKNVTTMGVPESRNTLNFELCDLLYDSLAFTDVLTGCRTTPEFALNRQLITLDQFPTEPRSVLLSSYDLLIDEKHVAGLRVKQRWSVQDGWDAVKETVAAAKYLASQRSQTERLKLILVCQGVDAFQYRRCTEQILEFTTPDDVIGFGGWCILGREKSYMPTFWQSMKEVIPLIAQVTQRVHIFGVTWYKKHQGISPPLPGLLKMCDEYGITLSTDGRSPIDNALRKDWKRAGAKFPYWRHNLAWTKAKMATLRESAEYQQFII